MNFSSEPLHAPLFVAEEIHQCDKDFQMANLESHCVFVADVSNVIKNNEDIEVFCCAYLLNNAVLMDAFHRKITKVVYLRSGLDEDITPHLNQMRSLFHSDFASLENINVWQDILSRSGRCEISASVIARIKSTIEFVGGAGLTKDAGYHRADIYLGVESEGDESPFHIKHQGSFNKEIITQSNHLKFLTSEVFSGGNGFNLNADKMRNIILLEIDLSQPDWVESWVSNIELTCSSEIYGNHKQ